MALGWSSLMQHWESEVSGTVYNLNAGDLTGKVPDTSNRGETIMLLR